MVDGIAEINNTRRQSAAPAALAWPDVLVGVLLVGVLLMGAFFRFTGTNWDDYVHYHPDERFTAGSVAMQMGREWLSFSDGNELEQEMHCREQYPETNGIGGFWDARCSSWNPHNLGAGHFAYGTFPFFVAKWAGDALNSINGTTIWTSYDGLPLVWRTLSAVYDMVTLLAVFLLGHYLWGKWVGLLAAFLYACAVLPIQISHFATADAMTAMWVVLTLYFTVRAQRTGNWLDFALAGAAFGGSIASRANVFPLVLVIIFAAAVRMTPVLDSRLPWDERRRAFLLNFGGLVMAGALTIVVFRIFNPYAFVGPGFFGISPNPRWLEDLGQARYETSTENSAPPQWQWIGRPRYFFAWWNMVVWGMGIGLGITGWLGWAWSGWRFIKGRADALKNAPLFLWILVYFGWVGANFVMSMRYYLPMYAALAVLSAWLLVELIKRAQASGAVWRRGFAYGLTLLVAGFTLFWAVGFTNIYRNLATFAQAGYWVWENSPGDFSMKIDGAPDGIPLINIAIPNTLGIRNDLLSNATRIFPSAPYTQPFTAPANGIISTIHAPRIGASVPQQGETTLYFRVSALGEDVPLAEAFLTDEFLYDPEQVGRTYDIDFVTPFNVLEGKQYLFTVEVVAGQAVATTGSVYTWEGAWVEAVPVQVCDLPEGMTLADDPRPGMFAPGECARLNASSTLITTNQFDLTAEDDDAKRDLMIRLLDTTDYIIIGSNRRYDSQSRIPMRWPLTNAYYDALWSGELGFELVAQFTESFEVGPIKINDQHLPTFDAPDWLNELEAEEAFSVYDHPAQFIFKKTDAYSPQNTRDILYSVPLQRPPRMGDAFNNPELLGAVTWDVAKAQQSATQIQFTDEMQQIQYEGGTWSERFDRDSAISQNGVVSVLVWWITITVTGLLVFPLLFVAFPALSDRGYGLARFFSLFLIGWVAWLASTVHVPLWSTSGLWLVAILIGAVSLGVMLRNRAAMWAFLREKHRLLIQIEVLFGALFLLMVFVRMTNPDLWTVGFGGEKPMDFAYLNGVLRSTIFPPIDPWYAGGYLNYYYFGFVIVGVPVLILQMVPSVAYNLIVPTIFAAAGVGAFSLAYSIVARLTVPDLTRANGARRTLGSPFVAGLIALMLAVVVGSLDTPRVLTKGLAQHGGYVEISYDEYLIQEYQRANGQPPIGEDFSAIYQQVEANRPFERLPYELDVFGRQIGGILGGLGRVLDPNDNAPLPIGAERWFWAPSRIITESVGGNAITEMPYFTFVYGDLHAHMISLPLMIFALAFVFNELALAGREMRRIPSRALAVFFGALVCGLFIAVNSWDYPTFMLLAVLGLGYAWWLSWRQISRRSMWAMLVYIGGFIVLAFFAASPYTSWFATAYTRVESWNGTKTPLWAYIGHWGLFLFLFVSLLVWETGRWMRSVKVRALRERGTLLAVGLLSVGVIVLGSFIFAAMDYQVALIVVPLVVWIGVLFFRPNQSAPMQFVLVVGGLALCLTLGVEIVVLSGDIGRQNTVFKFYMQAWMIFAVVGGVAFAWVTDRIEQWAGGTRRLWAGVAVTLFLVAGLFPIMATAGKAGFRLADDIPVTLDGALFMEYGTYYEEGYPIDLASDASIIRWLQDNVQGSPVIMEAQVPEYRWGSRISIHTGLPAVIGWNNHQRQQRSLEPLTEFVWQRAANVNFFYETLDVHTAWHMLTHFEVDYVIVGSLERARYSNSGGLDKFPRMADDGLLELVYDDGAGGLVYRVLRDENPNLLAFGG